MTPQNTTQNTPPTQTPQAAPAAMMQMLSGLWVSRCIHVAAELGIADLLADGPRTSAQLAAATQTHAPSLYRVLRALAGVGIFTECDPDCFALTPLGATLQTGVPGSVRHIARACFGQEHYSAWEDVLHSVRTGQTAVEHVFGTDCWGYYAQHPEQARNFDGAMTEFTAAVEPAILDAYDFSGFRQIVDIGGGQGSLLGAVLQASPGARGILFDQPSVLAGAPASLEARGVAGRCRLVPGDFFESVPNGGDAYLMKFILHDWDDARAQAILRNCRRAMLGNSTLLLFESVLPDGDEPSPGKFMDINMLVMTGGQERTEAQWRRLLRATGFRLTRIVPTPSLGIIEAIPV